MCSVGDAVTYKAPTDVKAGDSTILARVGPGVVCAAIVTAINDEDGSNVNLRVFPDQQEDFSIKGLTEDEDPVKGSYAEKEAAAPPPARSASKAPESRSPMTSARER